MEGSRGQAPPPEARIEQLEREVAELTSRVASLERPAPATARPSGELAAGTRLEQPSSGLAAGAEVERRGAAAGTRPEKVVPRGARPLAERLGIDAGTDLEDLLGGRVLAWIGGLAVLLGIVFLFAVAVSHGWIGEGARTALAGLGSTALLVLGVWLHERRARTDAALAAVATGIAGSFVTATVAARVYELVPALAGIALALVVGSVATALAVRWDSRGIGALGILGALLSPVVVGAEPDSGTVAILFVALASAAGVLLWRRWGWLALAAFGVSAPQWVVYLFANATPASAMAVLTAFGALGAVVAVGHDVRLGVERLRSTSAFLLALNAIVIAAAGWFGLDHLGEPELGKAWLVSLAAVHVAIGVAGRRNRFVSPDLGLLSLTLGVVLADVAFGLLADGPVLTIGWAASGVGFAWLLRHTAGRDEALTGLGLGGHVGLALAHALVVDAPPNEVAAGGLSAAAAAGVVALAAGCLVSARLAQGRPEWRIALDAVGLAAVAYLTALSLDGESLVLAWAAESVALAAIARRFDDLTAACASLGFLSLAGLHALALEAPPSALVTGLPDPLAGVAALGSVAAAAILAARGLPRLHPRQSLLLHGVAAVVLLYLASGLVVTPFESGDALDSAVLSAHQQGQMVLSVFWALVGVGTLVLGLRRELAVLRLAALSLLGVAIAKVFLLDLATLTSVYRVVSLIGLGLLLLVGAFVWQRLRPRALPDLRETPEGVR